MSTTETNPIAVLGITWGNPPRWNRDVWERFGYPHIKGTAWITFRGTAAMVGVGAIYRGEHLDYLFLDGLERDIRDDIEWALAPFHDLTSDEVDAMVAAVIAAVRAETVTE